jgi:uncharacterized protein
MKKVLFSLLVFGVSLGLFITQVDLEPKITSDFFFESEAGIYKQHQQIASDFPSSEMIIVNVEKGDVKSPEYYNEIKDITSKLEKVSGVVSVLSVSKGPKNIEAALNNPLWSRLLATPNSSNIIINAKTDEYGQLVSGIEGVLRGIENAKVRISGVPYIVNKISENLKKDINTFSSLAVLLFAIMTFIMFRSLKITAFILLAQLTAGLLTIYIEHLLGIPVGVMTANLFTMVMIITLSHLMYLVSNWQRFYNEDASTAKERAIKYTILPCFWSMITNVLGFASLLIVQAAPLKELGKGGVIGAFLGFVCAFVLFPPVLNYVTARKNSDGVHFSGFFSKKILPIALVFLALFIYGTSKISTDPSLLDYFDKKSEMGQSLKYLDDNGGSSPLMLVIKSKEEDGTLDTDEEFVKMKKLNADLEAYSETGAIISLPVLMEEVLANGISSSLGWDTIFSALNSDEYGNLSSGFVDFLRENGVFFIRMKEGDRKYSRPKTLDDIKKIVEDNGFSLELTGGAFALQSELAADIKASVFEGIIALHIIFTIIGFIISRHLWTTISITASVAFISLAMLGLVGFFKIPLDLISSPAVNVCIGIAIDTLIHLTLAVKRSSGGVKLFSNWQEGIKHQAVGAITSAIVIVGGFAIFMISTFPPTVRFGGEILFGSVITIFTGLILYPALIKLRLRK